jgi:LmbE family N-acetylglucosaminyl deacetylase
VNSSYCLPISRLGWICARASVVALSLWTLLVAVSAPAQTGLRLVTDRPAYNVGADVSVRFISPSSAKGSAPANFRADFVAAIRYAGEDRPITSFPLPGNVGPSAGNPAEDRTKDPAKRFARVWRVPPAAKLGRYEIDLQEMDPQTHQVLFRSADAASFIVYAKLVRIEQIKLDETFYTSGDPVSSTVTVENLTNQTLSGLRVEFSKRYWPWIAGPADAAKASIVILIPSLDLPAGGSKQLRAEYVEVAPEVKQPSTQQYGVVVWDHDRKTVLDISFSHLVFVRPPGVEFPVPYPDQCIHPGLKSLDTKKYRHFYPPELDSPAIQYERDHTMFPTGAEGEVRVSLHNPTSEPWHGVTARLRLLDSHGAELANKFVLDSTDLNPAARPLNKGAKLTLPSQAGVYRAVTELRDASGRPLASNTLEFGVNPLPRSILMFCAHEDDEGDYSPLIRAAVENRIPIHFVYFTSGDAGSCDRYYEHSCGPSEAANFGTVRMEEVRASLGHLGVPREAIKFLGLPDGGSGMIWYHHLHAAQPFLDPLLATDHAPYEGLVHANLPYARDAVVDTVKELIREFRPEVICTVHPRSVGHIDHVVNNYFVVKALQELLKEGAVSANLSLLVNRVYNPKEQPKTPYHYRDRDLFVSGEVAALGQEAAWFHQSQTGNRAEGNVRDFVHLSRKETFRELLDWSQHEGWNERP